MSDYPEIEALFKDAKLNDADGWLPPVSLNDSHRGEVVPTFPIEAVDKLCPTFANLCRAIAMSLQVPIDIPACIGLAALSVPIAHRVKVAIQRGSYIPAVIWTLLGVEPGERKSAVVKIIKKPFLDYEAEARRDKFRTVAHAQAEFKRAEAHLKELHREIAREQDDAKRVLLKSQEADLMAGLSEPFPQHLELFVDDATAEAVEKALEEQDGKIACISDEAALLNNMLGQYSGKTNIEVFLKGWDGSDYKVKRITRATYNLQNIFVVIGWCFQPTPLLELANHPIAQGRGFYDRFLVSLPSSLVGHRTPQTEPIPQHLLLAWHKLIYSLFSEDVRFLDLSPEGERFIVETESYYEPLYRTDSPLYAIKSWCCKAFCGQVVRVAAALHLAAGLTSNILSIDALRAALRIMEYFLEHHKAVYAIKTDNVALSIARLIYNHLLKHDEITTFTFASFRSVLWSLRKTDDNMLAAAYDLLRSYNIVKPSDPRKTGNRSSFLVNPKLHCP